MDIDIEPLVVYQGENLRCKICVYGELLNPFKGKTTKVVSIVYFKDSDSKVVLPDSQVDNNGSVQINANGEITKKFPKGDGNSSVTLQCMLQDESGNLKTMIACKELDIRESNFDAKDAK